MRSTRFLIRASTSLLAGGFLALTGIGTAAAQPTTQTFSFTGGAQSFTAPENVCEITVDAFGAEGGDGDVDSQVFGTGALGGRATATVSVTPGETLQVLVGGAGDDAPNAGLGTGGFPDGGDGGSGGTNAGGGGGGGSSSVVRGTDALVVAGAGGGGGGSGSGPTSSTFETGVRSGDGEVTITFDPDPVGCPSPSPSPPAPPENEVAPATTVGIAVVAVPRLTG